jgi:hypothetical protein
MMWPILYASLRGHMTTRHTGRMDIPTLIAKTKAFRRAESLTEERRLELANAIVSASVGGVRQSEIVRITGYTREHVRRLVRDAAAEASAAMDEEDRF